VIRIAFSNAAKRAIERRATGINGSKYCEQCGAECVSRADYELDHITAEALQPHDDRLPLSAEHGKLLCLNCHDKKTRRDVAAIAKAKRLAKKHRVVADGQTEIARRFRLKQEGPER